MDLMAKVFMDLHASSNTQETAAKDVIIPHRSTVSSHNHHALFMPSRLAPLAGTAVKIVSVPTAQAPAEVKGKGLPASTIVLDEQTGEVAAVVNARKLTPLRNAASESPHRPEQTRGADRTLYAQARCLPAASLSRPRRSASSPSAQAGRSLHTSRCSSRGTPRSTHARCSTAPRIRGSTRSSLGCAPRTRGSPSAARPSSTTPAPRTPRCARPSRPRTSSSPRLRPRPLSSPPATSRRAHSCV